MYQELLRRLLHHPVTFQAYEKLPAIGGRSHESDRRGSNPRPPEPQSDVIGIWALLCVAELAYLKGFLCWWLPAVSGCCVLSGVSSGVKRYRQPLPCSALSHPVPCH